MREKTVEENKALCEKYPFLLPKNVWTGQIDPDYDYSYTLWDLGPGWDAAFGDIFLEELGEELEKTGFTDQFVIVQLKEKYGELRLYTDGCPRSVQDIIDKYEYISGHVCYECGALDVPVINDSGWYTALCEECYNKHVKQRQEQYGKSFKWNPPTYEALIKQDYEEHERDFTIPEQQIYMSSRLTPNGEYEEYQRVIPLGDTVKKIRARAEIRKREESNELNN